MIDSVVQEAFGEFCHACENEDVRMPDLASGLFQRTQDQYPIPLCPKHIKLDGGHWEWAPYPVPHMKEVPW